jgi:GNAT superfamily N-acetyltransferase
VRLEVRERAGDALALVEEVHAAGRPIGEEYPLVFRPDGPGRVVVAEEAGRVVSTCAILERELVFPDGSGATRSLRVGLIGSVTTAPHARGRGLARAVLDRAEEELGGAGCALAVLWADDPAFYERRGYREFGAELDLALPAALALALPDDASVDGIRPEDVPALHALYLGHGRRAERTLSESRALLSTPGMVTAVARDGAGVPLAYACLGRGHDLEGVVHEWAGEDRAVLACLRAHLVAGGAERDLFLMAPPAESTLVERLVTLGAPNALGVLAMARVLEPRVLADGLLEGAGDTVRLESVDGQGAVFVGPAGRARRENEELLSLLCPPRLDPGPREALEAELGAPLPAAPWTPFLWGLDSI